jgi:hypothetical protein
LSPVKPDSHCVIAVNCALQLGPNGTVWSAAATQSAWQVSLKHAVAFSDPHATAQACCRPADPLAEPPLVLPPVALPPAVFAPEPTPPEVPPAEATPLGPGVARSVVVLLQLAQATPSSKAATRTWRDERFLSIMGMKGLLCAATGAS